MSAAEILYDFRNPHPDSLQRGRAQVVKMEAWRDGALVAPTAAGSTFSLIGPNGTAIIDAQPITTPVSGSIASYPITAEQLPATLEFSSLYMQRWALKMPDGTTRPVLRECSLAPYPVHPVCTEADLLEEYPDLVAQLGNVNTHLQTWLDGSWKKILRRLYALEKWPDLMISRDAFFDIHLQTAFERIYRYLMRKARDDSRWETLWKHHNDELTRAWAACTSRIDADFDGLADSERRESTGGVVHRNINPLGQRNVRLAGF